jgi:uracil-DNA glycosylase family 4
VGSYGLFETRTEAKGEDAGRLVRSAVDINPTARTPDMKPSGAKAPLVYLLGEAPGEEEDLKGVQFCGKSGQLLRPLIPRELAGQVRWNNAVRTRPVEAGPRGPKNRMPTPQEVAFYLPSLRQDIETARPRLLLALGSIPFRALLPDIRGEFSAARGQLFPLQFGGHRTWVCPFNHPSYILRIENERKVEKVASGAEWKRVWELDFTRLLREAEALPVPEVYPAEEIESGLELLRSPEEILRFLKGARADRRDAAFDFETSDLRPYAGAKLLTVAIAQGERVVAFPLEHRDSGFTPAAVRQIWEAFLDWLRSPARKVAHNLAFELEWLAFRGGALRPCPWGDTQAGAYVLDERPGGHGLGFISQLYFGFELKSRSPSINRSRLEEAFLGDVLKYNALDAKFTLLADARQQVLLRRNRQQAIYAEHIRRIPGAVGAQLRGLLVAPEQVRLFQQSLSRELDTTTRALASEPAVEVYRQRYGIFNPASNTDLVRMFRDVLRRPEGKRGDKYSTDEDVLKQMKDEPLAAALLKMRGVAKLKSTYVDGLDPLRKDSYVWPDGRLHPQFKTLATDTGRFASEGPNGQNWPKRKHAEIRKQIVPGKGRFFVAADYSQIEARVIAMFSRDPTLCKAIRARYDIHLDWAERLVKAHPQILDRYPGGLKEFRKVDVKNAWTFPLFYGATSPHVAAMLEMPVRKVEKLVDQFWAMFPGVLSWGTQLRKDYRRLGYVETLTGRRRHAPLGDNHIGNTPVQGTASDLVVDAGNRLSEFAELDPEQEFLQYVLNIHDDLTFSVPKPRLEESVELIVNSMVTFEYPWLNDIPIEVEVSVGHNWYDMKPLGKFASDEAA